MLPVSCSFLCGGFTERDQKAIDMILPPKERTPLRVSRKFNNTNKPWNDYWHGTAREVGSTSMLSRLAQQDYENHGGTGVLPYYYFENYYFYSGLQRRLMLSCREKFDKKEIDISCGRTPSELLDVAESFQKTLVKLGHDVSVKEALNYVYIRTLDESYLGIVREYKAREQLIAAFPQYQFEQSSYELDHFYGVDILVKKNGKTVLGYQVKTTRFKNSKWDYSEEAKEQNREKFEKCKRDFGFDVEFLWVDHDGNVVDVPTINAA